MNDSSFTSRVASLNRRRRCARLVNFSTQAMVWVAIASLLLLRMADADGQSFDVLYVLALLGSIVIVGSLVVSFSASYQLTKLVRIEHARTTAPDAQFT